VESEKRMKQDLIEIDESKAVLQQVALPGVNRNVSIYLKRLDLIHPYISGNKWYKLKYNLQIARQNGYKTLLTFGGAYSNHIAATAAAGQLFGFNTIGIIRGEQQLPLNSTLDYAAKQGMDIHYKPRSFFKKRNTDEFFSEMKSSFGDVYILPEGGTNELAVKGTAEILNGLGVDFDYVTVACGTGGTIAGIIAGLNGKQKVIGFSVLKGAQFLFEDVRNLILKSGENELCNWTINTEYHFGGYAKITKELIDFKLAFEKKNKIELDYIYTAKMLFGLRELINQNTIKQDSSVIAIHTGGLQGNKGMSNKVNRIQKSI